jgi:hypothetical protein
MKIFISGEKPRAQASFIMSVAPAATVQNEEVPAHWVHQEGDKIVPVQFMIEFIYGEAEVEDSVARYLIEQGLAKKSNLLLPNQDF